MAVSELMRREPSFAAPDLSVARLVHDHLVTGDDRALPVVDGGTLLGLVSISDVRALRPEQWETTPIGAIMRRADALSVTSPEEPLSSAFEKLVRENVGQLPVIAEGRFVGMLRRRDVARWLELAWKPGGGVGDQSRSPGPRAGRDTRDDRSANHADGVKHPA
jgi:CBS domain-containing protein